MIQQTSADPIRMRPGIQIERLEIDGQITEKWVIGLIHPETVRSPHHVCRNQGFPFRLPDPVIGKKLHAEIPANDPQVQNIEESIGYKRVVLFSLHNSAVRHPAVHIMMIKKKLQELAQALVVIDEGVLINI